MRKLLIIGGTLLLGLLVLGLLFRQELQRLGYQRSLFTGAPQHEHFVRQDAYYPVNEMLPAAQTVEFPSGSPLTLPAAFAHGSKRLETEAFLTRTDTGALLILQDGEVRYEDYRLTGGPAVAWLTHSISKSLVATAVGIAQREGLIESLDDPITRYVPALAGSGYDGTKIRDILQMASGIRWTEDYADRDSDLNRFGLVILTGGSYDEFTATRVRERPPGEFNHYVGMNSQALTMLVREATGMSLAAWLERHLWQPLGAQDRAFWTTDRRGVELGLGGLSASARDLAKVGELYRLGGVWNGQRILSEDWVRESTTVTAPHLARGKRDSSAHGMGYGLHWWLPQGDDQDYTGIGIYNQFVYVSPRERLVIVKLSAYRSYASSHDADAYLEPETISLFRSIAASL
ncbi:MAG: serine hydrolase [Pseudomonadota bacterium]